MKKHTDSCVEKYRSDIRERTYHILRVAKTRSKKYGIPFDLDREDIYRRVKNGRCEATGVILNLEQVGSGFAPSIDQIHPGQGYTSGNVQVVCTMYNLMKNNFDDCEVQSFLDQLQESHWNHDEASDDAGNRTS